MKHITKYLELIQKGPSLVADYVETLTIEERLELRKALELSQNVKLVRNLYYDYKSQKWIE